MVYWWDTNDKENEREFEINLDFLKDGKTYRVTSLRME